MIKDLKIFKIFIVCFKKRDRRSCFYLVLDKLASRFFESSNIDYNSPCPLSMD